MLCCFTLTCSNLLSLYFCFIWQCFACFFPFYITLFKLFKQLHWFSCTSIAIFSFKNQTTLLLDFLTLFIRIHLYITRHTVALRHPRWLSTTHTWHYQAEQVRQAPQVLLIFPHVLSSTRLIWATVIRIYWSMWQLTFSSYQVKPRYPPSCIGF